MDLSTTAHSETQTAMQTMSLPFFPTAAVVW